MNDDAELAVALHNLHCAAECGNQYAVALERELARLYAAAKERVPANLPQLDGEGLEYYTGEETR